MGMTVVLISDFVKRKAVHRWYRTWASTLESDLSMAAERKRSRKDEGGWEFVRGRESGKYHALDEQPFI